ncbi:phosphatase PAP2 family protein [Sinomonas sp. P10A9]|uniref:Phosphatase PAP2 family protein n=1 Tax=Sinomonas puerhi TaxID=3238584 RepID=A0AB39L547_9MICC
MLHVTASTRRAAAAVLATVGVVVFGWLLESVAGDWGLADLDWPVLKGLAAHRGPAATAWAQALHAGSGPVATLAVAGIVAAVWAVVGRELRRPALLLGAPLVDLALVTAVRYWVERERPPAWFDAVGGTGGPAFPSVHTSVVLTLLFVALYLAYSRRESPRGLVVGVLVAGVLVMAVAASDLYLGRHWLTDIVASGALSAIVLAGAVWIDSHSRLGSDTAAADVAHPRASADT